MTQLVGIIGLTITIVSIFLNVLMGTQVALIGIAFILVAAIGELVKIRKAMVSVAERRKQG